MTLLKRFKTLIIVIVLATGGFFVYAHFFGGGAEPLLSQAATAATSPADQNLITLLSQLKSIRLDNSIFTDNTFRSLQDFSQELVPEPIGRVNPFAFFDGKVAPLSSSPTPSAQAASKQNLKLPQTPQVPKKP